MPNIVECKQYGPSSRSDGHHAQSSMHYVPPVVRNRRPPRRRCRRAFRSPREALLVAQEAAVGNAAVKRCVAILTDAPAQ